MKFSGLIFWAELYILFISRLGEAGNGCETVAGCGAVVYSEVWGEYFVGACGACGVFRYGFVFSVCYVLFYVVEVYAVDGGEYYYAAGGSCAGGDPRRFGGLDPGGLSPVVGDDPFNHGYYDALVGVERIYGDHVWAG